ncbi:hypothetical protein, partial [uncultured Streptococcus sp.]|uniref:hypothetical protein n=1 Tax=uncultured Streptococcus sp. TaxID=83427 RepID=UPI003211ADF6
AGICNFTSFSTFLAIFKSSFVVLAVIKDFYLPQVCFSHTHLLYTIYLELQEKSLFFILNENQIAN